MIKKIFLTTVVYLIHLFLAQTSVPRMVKKEFYLSEKSEFFDTSQFKEIDLLSLLSFTQTLASNIK